MKGVREEEKAKLIRRLTCDRELFTVTHFKVRARGERVHKQWAPYRTVPHMSASERPAASCLPFLPLLYPAINSPKVDNIYAELKKENGEKTRITSKCQS